MAELTRLREENARLTAEVAALTERLAAYEDPNPLPPEAVAYHLEELQDTVHRMQSASDWVALWWVLTTMAKAPQPYAAFAEWANALGAHGVPPCKASLLYKADPLYQHPPYRWHECRSSQKRQTITRRLDMARTLKRLLTNL